MTEWWKKSWSAMKRSLSECEVIVGMAEVLVKNGEMVDYGKPLFRVKA